MALNPTRKASTPYELYTSTAFIRYKKHTPNFDTVHGLEIEKYCESVAVAGSFSLADRPAQF